MGLVRKRNPGGWVRMVADQIAQQLDGVSRLIAFVGEVGDLVDGGVIQLVGLVEVGPCLVALGGQRGALLGRFPSAGVQLQ